MRMRRLLLVAVCLLAMATVAAPAYAYVEEVEDLSSVPMLWPFMPDRADPATWTLPDPIPCYYCHGTSANTLDPDETPEATTGPHGGYLSTTNKCATCHTVHAAPVSSALLLPAATVKATCEACHDGTGGDGVYGVIQARTGIDPASAGALHSIDNTNTVPGGNAATGGSSTRSFIGETNYLTCTDCHSPHGQGVVNAFAGDRARSSADGSVANTVTSTRLLKRQPTTASAPTSEYGSDWCGGCHTGRLSGSGPLANHPVESSANLPTAGTMFYYNNVARVTGTRSETTELGTLGHNNLGYVMPDPRTIGAAGQDGHTPICQQCHEDARNVGDNAAYPQQVDTTEVFTITATDGQSATDNPRFQNFPHESQVPYFLVEKDDDLCLNCHDTTQLP